MTLAPMHRRMIITAIDVLAAACAFALAFMLRFEFQVPDAELSRMAAAWLFPALIFPATSYYFGATRAGVGDLADVAKAALASALIQSPLILLSSTGFPRSVLVLAPLLTVVVVAGLHGLAGAVWRLIQARAFGAATTKTTVIYGTGDLAEHVFQKMRAAETVHYRVVAFVSEGTSRGSMRVHGARLIAPRQLAGFLGDHPVDEIVIAVEADRRGSALDVAADALQDLAVRPSVLVAPTLEEALKSPTRAEPRKVRPADLLNRRVISLDEGRIGASIAGKTVLISGAGGTIGGELARQVARYKPRKLVLLENSATALFYIESELRETRPELELSAMLGDVRDLALLARLFGDERPQIVFHAAAHKHVHQLEHNVCEGVSNNLLGTYHLASAADRAGAEAFILISTDKAVRPTSVMGATKRAAEIVVTNFARRSKTRFACVRFGNVLGSSGSVMKIFQEQIEKGQPITITHPDATRYFMTVEEAVGLVLQSSTLAEGGEIFVLKMGDQVRILDMARRLIRLSGLEPDRDVPIRVVGLRQGEKLAEELIEDASGQEQSAHPEIMVLRSENKEVEELAERILGIELLTSSAEREAMVRALTQLVPTFTAAPGHDGARIQPVGDLAHDDSNN